MGRPANKLNEIVKGKHKLQPTLHLNSNWLLDSRLASGSILKRTFSFQRRGLHKIGFWNVSLSSWGPFPSRKCVSSVGSRSVTARLPKQGKYLHSSEQLVLSK